MSAWVITHDSRRVLTEQMKKGRDEMTKAMTTKQMNLPMPEEQAAELEELMRASSGAGISNKAEDNLVPQISVLQPLSPEVLDGPAKIEGAKPGDFLIGDNFIDGKTGLWFQPCFQDQTWLEFTPLAAGGGFVAQHEFTTENEPPPKAQRRERMRYVMPNGNEVIHYRQMAGLMWENGVGLEHVISFKSTGHTIARQWMTKASQSNRLPDGRQRALPSHVYHLTTSMRRNASGQWFVIDVGDGVLLGTPAAQQIVHDSVRAMKMGMALNKAFANQEKRAAAVAAEASDAPRTVSTADVGQGDEIPF
jgi:hypothetical protein